MGRVRKVFVCIRFSVFGKYFWFLHREVFETPVCLGHVGQDSSHLISPHLILKTFPASVEKDSNHPKAVGQIPPGRGGSRGALVASPGVRNKCIARVLVHFGCLG